MRSRSCAFWPCCASRRSSNSLRSPASDAARCRDRLRGARSRSAGNRSSSAPSRSASSRGCARASARRGSWSTMREIGRAVRLVEADQEVAGLDVRRRRGPADLADDAAGRVLHLLDVRFDHERAGARSRRRQISVVGAQHADAADAAARRRPATGEQVRARIDCGARRHVVRSHAICARRVLGARGRRRRGGGCRRSCSCRSTSSRGPNACTRPSLSTSN